MRSRIILSIIWACCGLAPDARAAVVTIYFAGTGMTVEDWRWDASKFLMPETVATLHHFQKAGPQYPGHYKHFIDGLSKDILNPKPDDWWRQNGIAERHLNDVPACAGHCITLNLVGFSRGGVSALMFANNVLSGRSSPSKSDNIKKVNVLAFDPVPGDGGMMGQWFNPSVNSEYIGFYARDERSLGFTPVFPARPATGSSNPQPEFFIVPGSHETLVGSRAEDGHDPHTSEEPAFDNISRTLKIVATEMLGSSDWGHVRFDSSSDPTLNLDWYAGEKDIEILRQRFVDGLENIYELQASIYHNMREVSFSPGLSAWDDNFLGIWDCEHVGKSNARTHARCAYYKRRSDHVINDGNTSIFDDDIAALQLNAPDPFARDYRIWDLIARRGSLDVDGDFVDYHDDNCPVTPNPDQANICAATPEPGVLALLGLGLAGLAATTRRRKL